MTQRQKPRKVPRMSPATTLSSTSSTSSPLPIDTERAWQAVAHRDAAFDGRFVFAVRSTGIYCRPSCPAKRPRRDRVEFHLDPAAAEAAGYRACRRCKPGERDPTLVPLEQARAFLTDHLDEPVSLAQLGQVVGLSPAHLQRRFRQRFGVSPREYVAALRMKEAKTHLRRGETVTRATFEAGFGAGSRLYAHADAHLGMTPGAFRRGGRGVALRYTVVRTVLGPLLVAASDRGLAAVMLGAGEKELEATFAQEYPRAERRRDDGGLATWVATVVDSIGAGAGEAVEKQQLPLDLQGTAFEVRVWKALQEIPRGATRSYGEIAAAIGQPTAARAVAQACAHNRLALVIPCHRVVRGDGAAGGYRWGSGTKERLLALEAATVAEPPRRTRKRGS
jgi:AraC family transcriptional regulator of adaptative response/methylated-DNA-[protein]-cysteine methyltransferase